MGDSLPRKNILSPGLKRKSLPGIHQINPPKELRHVGMREGVASKTPAKRPREEERFRVLFSHSQFLVS